MNFIVKYSRYHHAAFGSFTNQLTGNINKRYNNVERYFYLRRTNDSLIKSNERLYNLLKENYSVPDSGFKSFIDSLRVDSLLQYRKFTYHSARVVSNSVTLMNNYLVLDIGSREGIRTGMGVTDPSRAVIGIVAEVNDHYAVVMSLLHKDSHISGKITSSGETGTQSWDGMRPNLINLNGIPKSAKIKINDSVVTSGFSTAFPAGLKIGSIESFVKDTRTSQYRIKIRTAADFNNLQYAYVIQNADSEGVAEILEKVKKDNE